MVIVVNANVEMGPKLDKYLGDFVRASLRFDLRERAEVDEIHPVTFKREGRRQTVDANFDFFRIGYNLWIASANWNVDTGRGSGELPMGEKVKYVAVFVACESEATWTACPWLLRFSWADDGELELADDELLLHILSAIKYNP